ncbi:MAG: hypothetical protein MI923_22320 [Phycisphaerales bacterium]|nr:hypothetical protein [Phycisphaerales bacterium]
MTRQEAHRLIRSLRRQFLLLTVTRCLLLTTVAVGFLGTLWNPSDAPGSILSANPLTNALWLAATFAAVVWVALTFYSVRQVRSTNQATAYIASGRLDLAEGQLMDALRQFSLYRNGKLLACHKLALIAHGQKQYQVAAELCDGILSFGAWGGLSKGISRLCRIMLVDCHLFLGDVTSAIRALRPVSSQDPDLSLAEQLLVLPIELRCQIGSDHYERAASSLSWKMSRAELLDSPKAALAHALLAVACQKTGQTENATFLQRRAELYHDLDELAEDYDVLRERAQGSSGKNSAPQATSADNK